MIFVSLTLKALDLLIAEVAILVLCRNCKSTQISSVWLLENRIALLPSSNLVTYLQIYFEVPIDFEITWALCIDLNIIKYSGMMGDILH